MPFTPEELDRMAGAKTPLPMPPFCTGCGYDLSGAPSAYCPECGQAFVVKEWRLQVAQVQQQVKELDAAIRWVGCAIWIDGAGVAAAGLGLLLPHGCFSMVLRGVAGLCGFVAAFLALSLFRVGRLPPWMKDRAASAARSRTAAVAAIVLGIVVVGLVVAGPW